MNSTNKQLDKEKMQKEMAEMQAINKYAAPEDQEVAIAEATKPPPLVESVMDLDAAIRYAQFKGTHVEVSEKVYQLISGKSNKPYYTAGTPGVKVIKEGFVQRVKDLEEQNCEAHHDTMIRDKQAWNRK